MGSCLGRSALRHQRRTRPEDRIELLNGTAFSSESGSEGSEGEGGMSRGTPTVQRRLAALDPLLRPDPARSTLEGPGLSAAQFGGPTSFTLTLLNSAGEPCPCPAPIESLRAELRSLVDGSTTRCSLDETDCRGVYAGRYVPQARGRHLLSVALNAVHVGKSPFGVYVCFPPAQLGYPKRVIPGLALPHAITLSPTSKLLISEWDTNIISIFSRNGIKILEFGSTGRNDGEFIYPWGVVTDDEGFIYVADSFNNRIQKFTSNGEFVKAVGSLGNGPGCFNVPSAIGISKEKTFYVCDTNNRRVQILDADLNYVAKFGSMGVGPGQFWAPQSLAFDSTGNVFVVDNKNNNVQVFTSDGRYRCRFGGKGAKPGKLSSPVGIYIDSCDFVYVSEWDNCRVSVFDTAGTVLSTFGKKGVKVGEFSRPSGIVVDQDGFVYVCDHDARSGRVQVF